MKNEKVKKIVVLDHIDDVDEFLKKEGLAKWGVICPNCGSINTLLQGSEGTHYEKIMDVDENYNIEEYKCWVECENCGYYEDGKVLREMLFIITKEGNIYCQKDVADKVREIFNV